jgi:hypothetical protein
VQDGADGDEHESSAPYRGRGAGRLGAPETATAGVMPRETVGVPLGECMEAGCDGGGITMVQELDFGVSHRASSSRMVCTRARIPIQKIY